MAIATTTRRLALTAVAAITIALLLAACGRSAPQRDGAGAITKAGRSSLLDLRAGDCVTDLREQIENPDGGHNGVPSVTAAPCTQAHDGEVLLVAAVGGDSWPGFSIVNGEAARNRPAIHKRVAAARSGQGARLLTFKPTEERWNFEDQREIFYLVLYEQPRRGRL